MKGEVYGIAGGDGGYLVDLRSPDSGHDLVPPGETAQPQARLDTAGAVLDEAQRVHCDQRNREWWALHGRAGRVGVNR
jgi:hypothetical protein